MDISLLEETIMLYTETKELQKYRDSKRLWQGIPSIEVTKTRKDFPYFLFRWGQGRNRKLCDRN